MKLVSIIAHPRAGSFCHALCEAARMAAVGAGYEVDHHDLYAENFDPCLRSEEAYTTGDDVETLLAGTTDPLVRRHREAIRTADGLLVVHPNWWGKPPAILAGWLDRVLVPGVAYRLDAADGEPHPMLSLRSALILNTSDTPEAREAETFGDPLELIWGRCVLPFCGTESWRRVVFGPVGSSSLQEREGWLARAATETVATFGRLSASSPR